LEKRSSREKRTERKDRRRKQNQRVGRLDLRLSRKGCWKDYMEIEPKEGGRKRGKVKELHQSDRKGWGRGSESKERTITPYTHFYKGPECRSDCSQGEFRQKSKRNNKTPQKKASCAGNWGWRGIKTTAWGSWGETGFLAGVKNYFVQKQRDKNSHQGKMEGV